MPTEEREEGKLYYKKIGDEEYTELKGFTEEDVETEDIEEVKGLEGSLEIEIEDKETLRQLRKLCKTDKEKKEEQRYNKESFRKFIKERKRK